MRCRKLDENFDYSFGMNDQDYIDEADAVAQAIRTKILLFYGEWWENVSLGLPMFQSFLGQMSNENLKMSITLLLTKRIKEISEVKDVTEIEIARNNRQLRFTVHVILSDGEEAETVVIV
jgi:hypothetical protein